MQKQIAFLYFFERFIKDSSKGRRRTAAGKRITAGTIQQYHTVLKYLTLFEKQQHITLRIQLLYGHSKKQFLCERNYWKKMKLLLETFLAVNFNCFDMYISSVFKIMKTFFNYLHTEKGFPVGEFHRQFRFPSYSYQPVIINITQLQRIINDEELRKALPQHLAISLDIFIFGCVAGLRYNDLIHLKKIHVYLIGEKKYLQLTTQKTGASVNIPLPHFAVDILNRYKRKNGSYLFRRISNNNFNLHIKKIMEKAGYTYNVPKMRYKKGVLVEIKTKQGKTFRFCDHMSAHTMRRTAITTLLMLGVPELIVRKISGHAAGSKEFFRYVSLAQDYTNMHLENAYEKLLNNHEV